jgi:hypothetical protein
MGKGVSVSTRSKIVQGKYAFQIAEKSSTNNARDRYAMLAWYRVVGCWSSSMSALAWTRASTASLAQIKS